MTWKFDLVSGPHKGRTGGLAWDGAAMLFSAVMEERILRYEPGTGKAGIFRKYTGRTNGIAVAGDGSVFGAQEGGRRVIHFVKDGSTVPTSELLDGKHHNQPTDVVVDGTGRVWIADPYNAQPPYGPPAYPFLEHASVLRLDPDGAGAWKLERVTHDTRGPRSVLLSPDEKLLYVNCSRERLIRVYDVKPEGSLGKGLLFHQYTGPERGVPDGMKCDFEGNVYCTAPGGIYVHDTTGKVLARIKTPGHHATNIAWGDGDWRSLYITMIGSVVRTRLSIAGVPSR